MVRINLIEPFRLADQHLIAEYNEILMLLGYVHKFPVAESIPQEYCLGKGHIKFFKDKLKYLEKRHESLREEMRKRGFVTNKKIELSKFDEALRNDWFPEEKDFIIIKRRIVEKLKQKEGWYRYYSEVSPTKKLVRLIEGKS